jgi:proteic killer suppression protein
MIRSFRSKSLRKFAPEGDTSKLSVQNPARIRRILLAPDKARIPDAMNLPGLRFHSLKGEGKGRYAVDASGDWRITFGWNGEHAIEVDPEDYH